jgi:hypothetical protein
MDRRRIVTLTVALVLAAPGAAFAQSAGDEQYDDPFAGDDQEQATPTPTPTPAPASTPAPAGEATPVTAQATPTPAPSAAAAQEQLPRTGNDPIMPAVAGFWLLLGGVALRAKVRVR